MVKTLFFAVLLLLLCSSCVSRTTYKKSGIDGSKKVEEEKELIWFWDKDF